MGLNAEMLRWLWLMQRAPEELTGRAGELGGLLAARVPAERAPTLVHGDFHYGNMLFRGPEVVAVLDWEIAQIGQPLLDLGCLCIVSHRRQYEGAPNPGGSIDVAVEDLYKLYGADAGEMRWYLAMSLYKYAAIFGYNLMLHRRGKRPDPMYEGLTDTITGMIDEGIALLETGRLGDFSHDLGFLDRAGVREQARMDARLHARRGLSAGGARYRRSRLHARDPPAAGRGQAAEALGDPPAAGAWRAGLRPGQARA